MRGTLEGASLSSGSGSVAPTRTRLALALPLVEVITLLFPAGREDRAALVF